MSKRDVRELVERLATELTRLRQRGIDYVDRDQGRQRPLLNPILDKLCGESCDLTLPRHIVIRAFLRARLDDYAAEAEAPARLLSGLYFDREGRSPGPAMPRGLLSKARSAAELSDEAFRKFQRDHMRDFAAFLLRDPEEATEDVPTPSAIIDWRLIATATLVAFIFSTAAVLTAALILLLNHLR